VVPSQSIKVFWQLWLTCLGNRTFLSNLSLHYLIAGIWLFIHLDSAKDCFMPLSSKQSISTQFSCCHTCMLEWAQFPCPAPLKPQEYSWNLEVSILAKYFLTQSFIHSQLNMVHLRLLFCNWFAGTYSEHRCNSFKSMHRDVLG